MTEALVERILTEMKENPELRDRFVLDLFQNEIVKSLIETLKEIKLFREESKKQFSLITSRFIAIDKRFEENDKRFDALIKEMHEGFEKNDKRFEENDKRFDALIKEMHEGFEKNDKRFDALIKEMHEGFEKTNDTIQQMLKEIKNIKTDIKYIKNRIAKQDDYMKGVGGMALEMQDIMFFKAIVYTKGYNADKLEWRKIFKDTEGVTGMDEVEIDIFQEEPLVMGEVTSYVTDINKVLKFLKKIKFIKKKFGKEPYCLFITNGFTRDIAEAAKELLRTNNVEIIAAGENRDAILNLDWEYFNELEA